MFLIISQILQKSTCVGVSTWRAGNFIKKRVQHRCFPVKYVKFLRAVNLKNINHRRCSLRKGVLRNFAKFIWKHLCQSFFVTKVTGLRPAILLKKRFWHRCFPVNFAKFWRALFTQNTSGRLLLIVLNTHQEIMPLTLSFTHNVEKWPNFFHTAKIWNYIWRFFYVVHENFKVVVY